MSYDVDVEIWYYPMQKELEVLMKRFKKEMRGGEYYFYNPDLNDEMPLSTGKKAALVALEIGLYTTLTLATGGLFLPFAIGIPVHQRLKKKRKLEAARLKIVEDEKNPELVRKRIAKAKETLAEMCEIGKRHPCGFDATISKQTINQYIAYYDRFFSEAEKQKIQQDFVEINEFLKTRKEEMTVRIS